MIRAIEFGGAGGFWCGMKAALADALDHRGFIDTSKPTRRVMRNQAKVQTLDHYNDTGRTKDRIELICGAIASRDRHAAGARQRVAPEPGRALDVRRAAEHTRAQSVLLEVSPDLLGATRAKEFAALLGLFTGRISSVPRGGWRSAGAAIAGDGDRAYSICWRVLDLRYFTGADGSAGAHPNGDERTKPSLPHARKRIYLVATRGRDGRCEVLLDGKTLEGLSQEIKTEADHAELDEALGGAGPRGRVIAFPWRAGGYANQPITARDTLPAIHGDNVAIAIEGFKDVRGLTPEEVERAFDLPPGWTELGTHENGRIVTLSDHARYGILQGAAPPPIVNWIVGRLYAL